jgi:hypothetical protein
MPNELSGEKSNINDHVELPLPSTSQTLDSLQVVCKYICEQPEIPGEISVLIINENFTDRTSLSHNINNQKYIISSKSSPTLFIVFFIIYLFILLLNTYLHILYMV